MDTTSPDADRPSAIPTSSDNQDIVSTHQAQASSKFCTLPLELRFEIFSYLEEPTPILWPGFDFTYNTPRIPTLPDVCHQLRAEITKYLRPKTEKETDTAIYIENRFRQTSPHGFNLSPAPDFRCIVGFLLDWCVSRSFDQETRFIMARIQEHRNYRMEQAFVAQTLNPHDGSKYEKLVHDTRELAVAEKNLRAFLKYVLARLSRKCIIKVMASKESMQNFSSEWPFDCKRVCLLHKMYDDSMPELRDPMVDVIGEAMAFDTMDSALTLIIAHAN